MPRPCRSHQKTWPPRTVFTTIKEQHSLDWRRLIATIITGTNAQLRKAKSEKLRMLSRKVDTPCEDRHAARRCRGSECRLRATHCSFLQTYHPTTSECRPFVWVWSLLLLDRIGRGQSWRFSLLFLFFCNAVRIWGRCVKWLALT